MKKLVLKFKRMKRRAKKILKYMAMSLIICYGSAIILRLINAFLGINTPDLWWYGIPATIAAAFLSLFMVFANIDKILREPVKKKVATKQKVRRKSAPAVSTPEREYRRKVS